MNKILKGLGLILLFAVLVEVSPIIILVLIVAFCVMKGTPKEKANRVLDKTKKVIND